MPPATSGSEPAILIIDDTPANVGVLVDYLEDRGFRVAVAQDGEEGLKRAQFVQPDLILLDVMMPGMDGFETCRRLKSIEKIKDIPVIFMTALADTNEKVTGFAVGGVDYVTKPFQIEEVLARINTHLALRKANRDLADALEKLRIAQNELVQKGKLAALGSLVAGIAHELNTPIGNSLIVASTLVDQTRQLAEGYHDGLKRSVLEHYMSDADQATDMMLRNLNRAANLLASFKQVAVDQTSSQRRAFSLSEVVAEIMTTLWPSFKKTAFKVEQDIPDGILMDSYPGPLGQVLTNLVNNALLHGFEGRTTGLISISALQPEGGWVDLAVHDDGVGIPAENLDRIFDPFFTTKLGAGGSGLGLNIVDNLVSGVLGGRIRVQSELGIGTTFTLSLPLTAPLHAEENAAREARNGNSGAPKMV